tara:strand:+ start:580 stop:777 length:198 start_codon:yes stop_codon:yes gene_type:complete
MTDKAFSEAAYADRDNFIPCEDCGQWIDCRDLDEVIKHATDHRERPDVQYAGSRRIGTRRKKTDT